MNTPKINSLINKYKCLSIIFEAKDIVYITINAYPTQLDKKYDVKFRLDSDMTFEYIEQQICRLITEVYIDLMKPDRKRYITIFNAVTNNKLLKFVQRNIRFEIRPIDFLPWIEEVNEIVEFILSKGNSIELITSNHIYWYNSRSNYEHKFGDKLEIPM